MELETLVPRLLQRDSSQKMAAQASITSTGYPIDDVLSLLDSGFFDCDEEILEEMKSLESEVCTFISISTVFVLYLRKSLCR